MGGYKRQGGAGRVLSTPLVVYLFRNTEQPLGASRVVRLAQSSIDSSVQHSGIVIDTRPGQPSMRRKTQLSGTSIDVTLGQLVNQTSVHSSGAEIEVRPMQPVAHKLSHTAGAV